MKVLKETLKHLIIIATIIILTMILSWLFPGSSDSFYRILTWVFICYVMLGYFRIVFRMSGDREVSSLNRRSKAKKKNLYQWLGNEGWDDISFYQSLREEEKNGVAANLKAIKKAI